MSDPSRQELENLWRSRVRYAALRLDFARNYVKEVQRDFPAGGLALAEGRHARAINAENLALKQYRSVLRIFNDLIAHGKIPDENEWLKRKGTRAGGGDGQ